MGEEEARAFSREVEAAWKEFAEDDCCCIDVERKRTFTMMIREGGHAAPLTVNCSFRPPGYQFVAAVPDTVRMVSEAHQQNPATAGTAAGVQINDSGAALGYYVEDGYLAGCR
ncbi:hypothetical protein [Escherichia coli]|uniref:hypothetical protein n=1 Tax=Escherichia coli TaxID=562 RepID=UPI00388E5420